MRENPVPLLTLLNLLETQHALLSDIYLPNLHEKLCGILPVIYLLNQPESLPVSVFVTHLAIKSEIKTNLLLYCGCVVSSDSISIELSIKCYDLIESSKKHVNLVRVLE